MLSLPPAHLSVGGDWSLAAFAGLFVAFLLGEVLLAPYVKPDLSARNRLWLERVLSLVVGTAAILFAVCAPSIVDALLYAYSMWAPTIVIPLLASVVFGSRATAAAVSSIAMGAVVTAVWIWQYQDQTGVDAVVVGAGANPVVFALVAARHAGYQGRYSVHSGSALRDLEPALSSQVVGGVHARDELHLRPESLVAGLRRALEDRGVVIAAGMWTRELLRRLGVDVPLQAAKGYSITSTGSGTVTRHAMKLIEPNIACTPFEDGLRVSGRFDLAPCGDPVRRRVLRGIVRAARRYLHDWQPSEEGTALAGYRPSTPDSLPIIGAVPGAEGVFAATGHGMLGLTLAPATARALVQLMLRQAPITDLTPFAVGRFGLPTRGSVSCTA